MNYKYPKSCPKYSYIIYDSNGRKVGDDCYQIINDVIVLSMGERVLYFDKSAAVEGRMVQKPAQGKDARTAPVTREQAQADYDKAVASYNRACPYGCGGEPLKQWQKARDNLALASRD